ncbi:M91 family zinc metallopeptidase [Luteimonas sp. MJ250]|uniref:M91 family zinc metallopeptidase n=1 Tax=Luteimonas sp. MJ250 TaxID=3129236 RepID=UPI0031BB2D83
MSIQSANSLPGASAAAQFERAGYWNNPDAPHQHDRGAEALGSDAPAPRQVDVGGTDAVDADQAPGQEEGRTIDGGSDNPAGRSQRSTVDGKPVVVDPLHSDKGLEVARERTIDAWNQVSSDQLVFTTGAGNDSFGVKQRDDGTLDVSINGENYEVHLDRGQELTIRAGDGNDVIEVAPNVRVNIVVEGGKGDDTITTGAGDDRIDGGEGNDTVFSGAGRDDIFGGSGNDLLTGGEGVNIIHGGNGDDEITAGAGTNFIEGGAGDDVIQGAGTSDILSGGVGNDRIAAGDGKSTIYTGAGDDAVDGAGVNATVYAEVGDLINSATGSKPTVVNVAIDANAGHTIKVEGSEGFVQRIQSELDFLRASPVGQQMLAEFDKAADVKGNMVTIKELANEQNGYAQTFSRDADIVNGRAGAGGNVDIVYNPSFHMDAFPAPVVVLYHEMSHAYNGVNGSFQPGEYTGPGPDNGIANAERQAVGLETSAPAFDFDGDRSTAPTTANPDHLTENGIREELGMPDRPSYALEF